MADTFDGRDDSSAGFTGDMRQHVSVRGISGRYHCTCQRRWLDRSDTIIDTKLLRIPVFLLTQEQYIRKYGDPEITKFRENCEYSVEDLCCISLFACSHV
jgi:hypothetical protein